MTLVQDVATYLSEHYDKTKLTVQIPSAFNDLENLGKDYEICTSPSIKQTTLNFNKYLMNHSVAHIFVNTECKSQIGKLTPKQRE